MPPFTEDGKLRVCLSYAAKWLAGIVATLVSAILLGGAAFAWQSKQTMGQILEKLSGIDAHLARHDRKFERIDDKLDGKRDK